jgi:hypothetical protein
MPTATWPDVVEREGLEPGGEKRKISNFLRTLE